MVKEMFALNMPEGAGLMAYLEKGEKGLLRKVRDSGRSVQEVRVEDGQLVVPPELEKKLGLSPDARRCRFVHDRTAFVRWDGRVAPCMGLLHSHKTYLYGLERQVRAHTFGSVREDDLFDIWNSQAYADFRDKVKAFDFSPCHVCGGCSLLEKNEEDCYGNDFPACGGCLWAQGIIQCP